MKRITVMLLATLFAAMLAAGCGAPEAASPSEAATGETKATETTAQTTDPVVIQKEEDPETVVEGQVDFSQLDTQPQQTTVPTEKPTEKPTEPSAPEETIPTTEHITAATESDGYYDVVIKP